MLSGGVSFGTDPLVKVKPVPQEHPQVETPNVSQKKYFVVKSEDVTVNSQGITINGLPDANDGNNFPNYVPLVFSPNYNDLGGYWRIKPGVTNFVNGSSPYNWYSDQSSLLDGDWLIGQESAGQATYYSIADGDWNDPNTWSKENFSGVASTTAPNKRSDKVRIQDHIVTISGPIAEAKSINVETGTEGRVAGILKISGDNVCTGDTFNIQNNAIIFIGHTQGISDATGTAGAIQMLSRTFSDSAVYCYWEDQTQITGLGLPNTVRTLICDKTAWTAVSLSKNTKISDSLFINEGVLDLAASSLDGLTNGKKLVMLGGELIVRNNFPTNYTPPTFNFGKVTFDGAGNALIPSSGSVPGVLQYNKLNIRGTRSGDVSFDQNGVINIIDSLDVSNLTFDNNTYGFLTANSTVRFAKNGGNQYFNFKPFSPDDDLVNLKFYKLILDSSGAKTIINNNPGIYIDLKVTDSLLIKNGANFVQNGLNIELQGSWNNVLGTFTPTAGKSVTMNSVNAFPSVITITSRDTTDNPFQNLIIKGIGTVSPNDNLKVLGDVILRDTSTFVVNGPNLFLHGNWINQGGTFTHTNSTAYFEGSITQSITKAIDGNETFYNLVLRNPAHLNSNGIGPNMNWGLFITNNLDLNYGRINARDRFVQVGGTITRIGGGYINSRLRRNMVNVQNSERTFEIGYENSYTPATIMFIQNSIAQEGILQLYSDTITTSTIPISWADGTPSSVMPLGSKISPYKHIARQWTIEKPTNSTFLIASNGKYQFTPHFIGVVAPNGDLRNGMNPLLSDASLYDSTTLHTWIYPRFYPPNYKDPDVSLRSNDSITYGNLKHFGSLIVGEPSTLTFYTRGTGNWNDPNNWSLVYYDGPVSTEYPGQTKQNYVAYIGASHEITLESNKVVNDSLALDGFVAVDSSGVLNFGQYNISGSGEFRIYKEATVKLADPDGITNSANSGNVRTTTREYNYLTNNMGTFIYNYAGNQSSGNGLPSGADSVKVIIADNNGGTLTLASPNLPINIKDSLYIKNSNLNSGANNITLGGNLRIQSPSTYTHNSMTFSFTGVRDTQRVAAYSNVTFYNMNLSKNKDLSFVKFDSTVAGNSFNIQIENNLNFEANNKAYINLSPVYDVNNEPDYNKGEWYMTIASAATVTRTNIGHIDGELRKNVPANDIPSPGIKFEVGSGPLYKPFIFDLDGSGGTAGFVGVQSIPHFHKFAYWLDNVNFNLPIDRMIKNYWRVTRPELSLFDRGGRSNFDLEVGYANPQDIPPGASIFCFDLTYWKGVSIDDWQRLSPPPGQGNKPPALQNNGSGDACIDRKIVEDEAIYAPLATDSTTRAEIQSKTNAVFGNQNLNLSVNNRYLLADVVIGQQGARLKHFYTRQNGLWTDPNTWSEIDYNGAASTDFPKEKLHVAHIGEGHTVTLDGNIGNGINLVDNDGTQQYYEQCLGLLEVEKTTGGAGHLSLSTFVIRTAGFRLKDGGILETGATDGFHSAENRGNIIQENIYIPIARDFNYENHNNGNYIFNPSGLITTTYLNSDYVYCNIDGFHDRKARVASLEAAEGAPYNSANVIANYYAVESDTKGYIYLPYYVYWLKAGQEYTFRIHGGVSDGMKCINMRAHLYMDWNFNGNYSDLGERLLYDQPFPDENCYIDVSFTVPDTIPQGTTQIRVIAGNGNIEDPCEQLGLGQSGGSVDFTVHIENPNFAAIHYTGEVVPAQIASLTVNADSCGQYVEQNSDISVKDSILIEAGQFSTGNDSLTFATKLQGDLINNSGLEGLRNDLGGFEFNGALDQYIRGSSPGTKMWNTTLNNIGNSIILQHELTNRNLLSFTSDCKLDIEDANLYFDTTAQQISTVGGSFGSARMITSHGELTSHNVTKYFPSTFGATAEKEFFFPIGFTRSDSAFYNPVYMKDTISSFAEKPTFTTQIVGIMHPQLPSLSANYLKLYWPVNSSNFSNIDNLNFYYNPVDLKGDSVKFIPAILENGYWRFDVGTNPSAQPSPITIINTRRINGDWAVYDTTLYDIGTIYYSRQSGTWSDPNCWSTDEVLKHQGPPTSFYPGQIFSADTVNIDGHDITFNVREVQIDSLRIGGSNDIDPPIGKLIFGININNKELRTRVAFLDDDLGEIDVVPGGAITDTLGIYEILLNNSQGGINSSDGATHTLNFSYIGNANSEINGTGLWQNISGVILNKQDGLEDTVFINSPNFSIGSHTSNPKFTINNGLLISNSTEWTLLSGETHTVEVKTFGGLDADNGDFQTNSHLRSYPASLIKLEGSNIYVGNHSDENYIYETGTIFRLDSGKFVVGGAFIPQNVSQSLDLKLDEYGEITVAKYGYTGTLPSFDLSNNSSAISMTGGRIILANGNTNAVSNLTINATGGTGLTGGEIQIGDSILTTSPPTTFTIGGSRQIYNLHLVANDASPSVYTTSLITPTYSVRNNILIDPKQILNINGKILNLQGNLLSYGLLNATPSIVDSDPWRISITGTNDQYFNNFNSTVDYFEIFNLEMNKPSGTLILGDGSSEVSSIKVNEYLDFTADNLSFIDAQTYLNKVILGPSDYSIGQYDVFRTGLGHVFGTMSRYAPVGTKSLTFTVGADTLESYRPVVLDVSGSDNTAGYIDVTPFNIMHPFVANSKLIPAKTLSVYWAVYPSAVESFALGTTGKYSITTYFLNPDDIPGGSDPNFYEHSYGFDPFDTDSWFSPIFEARTSTSVRSKDQLAWGDYIVGNPVSTTFWSFNDGDWEDVNSWSLASYNVQIVPTRIPDMPQDIVRIGNGKTITLEEGLYPAIKSVIIEKYNNLPGILQMNGAGNYVSGSDFTLNDSCTLGLQNSEGISASGLTGAVRTNVRDFGIARYIYNSQTGNQITGNGLPVYVQSLIINNSNTGIDKTVTLIYDALSVNIVDSLYIEQGTFNSGGRYLRLLGDFVLDSKINDGNFEPQAGKITFDSTNFHNVIMKNNVGLNTYDVDLKGGDVYVGRDLAEYIPPMKNHWIKNNLNFSSASKYILGDTTNLIITNPVVGAITNYAPDRFVRTSHTSGMLIRDVNSVNDYFYPIGSFESGIDNYTPMRLSVQSLTTEGQLGVRVSPGETTSFPGGHAYVRTAVTSEYLKRFWMIDSVDGNFSAAGRFYYVDSDVFGNESNYNRLGRWRPQNEGSPGLWYEWSDPPIDITNNYFGTFNNFNSAEFTGDWTLGNPFAFRRIFFSLASGAWSNPNSWTESPTHNGPIFGPGIWPDAASDSVQIGEYNLIPHEISLDVDAINRGTSLGTNPANRGILNTNFHLIQGEYFTMGDLSWLKITSPEGISALPALTGNIQSTGTRTFPVSDGIFEYNGNANQVYGDALPGSIYRLIINNTGLVGDNIVTSDKNLNISTDLTITQGTLDLQTFTANNSTGTGNFTNSSLGRVIIGGSNNLLTAVNNYSSYLIDVDSYTEFNGILNQNIYEMPANLDLDLGLGNVDLNNAGIKYTNQFNSKQMIIRGNLRNFIPAVLEVIPVDNTLWIKGNILNQSIIKNYGVIDLGERGN
ncbi:MAG: hypothetical protein A2X64_04405 [Ignavibacteria bacterium GWF2_33_9]|nr:MAG: hypothetical protein A2X64_04405 [Ignavibacteria bacterium GWF2_33_9]